MDNAVALVQAYLRLNGYLTVSEHPVIGRHGTGFRIMTDLDILAVRFPNSGDALGGRPDLPEAPVGPDPMLRVCGDRPDMLIGEVKEGRAVLNAAATNPGVVRAALLRFGCCGPHDLEPTVRRLLERGTADLANGHRVRLVAFGTGMPDRVHHRYLVITLGRCLEYLTAYVRDNWDVVRHTESKDPALGMLMLLEKIRHAAKAGDSGGPAVLPEPLLKG